MTAPSMPLIVDLTTTFDNAKQEIAPIRTFTRTNSFGHPMMTRSKDGTRRSRAFLSIPYPLLLYTITSISKPTSCTQASKDT